MNSEVSAGSDVAYINIQSWKFLDRTEESYKKPESDFWIEIQDRICRIEFHTKKASRFIPF